MMPRVAKVPVADWDPELRAMIKADERTELEQGMTRMLAHIPEIAKPFMALQIAMKAHTILNPRLRELVRLRIAFHNQCRSCMAVRYPEAFAAGMDEQAVCSLEAPQEAENLSAAEKAAIAFADKFATNHWAIDDADYEALRAHFTEPQIIELGLVCAMCVGGGRLVMTWNMVDEIPAAFRDGKTGATTPWQGEPVIVKRR
jgi:AhpD family alkylhydroperoxidase